MSFQKFGGYAAFVAAFTYIFGFGVLIGVLAPAGYAPGVSDPEAALGVLERQRGLLLAWNFLIYILNGLALVVLVYAVSRRIGASAPDLSGIAAVFGYIWAALVLASGMIVNVSLVPLIDLARSDPQVAQGAYAATTLVREGLGGGNELVGGVWVALASWAALRAGIYSRWLHILGLVIGAAGMLTIIPGLADLGAIFGFGLIAWFVWMGISLTFERGQRAAAAA
jgi:hypothetical protein